MRTTIALALVVIASGVAAAQPGMTEPQPPPPPPSYTPYAPMPYTYQPQVVLDAEDRELLAEGEISSDRHIGGGMLALFFGFGTGQAIQGRWTDTGWIFTVGEPVAFTTFMYGVISSIGAEGCTHDCHGNKNGEAIAVGSMFALVGLRIWEIADAFIAPPRHNARVRAVRARLGYAPAYARVAPYVAPANGDGGVAGLALRF